MTYRILFRHRGISVFLKNLQILVFINFIVVPPSLGEIYTSVVNVQKAISVEKELLSHLRTYIEDETLRLNDIKRFYAKVADLHSHVYHSPVAAMANPLVAYTLIKRLQSEWLNVVHSNEAHENSQAFKSGFEKEEGRLPNFEDLEGAAKGLMRLQDVYSLRVEGLANGLFQRVTAGQTMDIYRPAVIVPLSGDDCFQVGKVAYEMEDFYHSVQWLEEAARLFRRAQGEWITEDEGNLKDTLDHLAYSHFKTGNISYAWVLSQELLRYDPSNKRVSRNIEKYEKLLAASPPIESHHTVLQRPNSTYLHTRHVYERLCQTLGSQPKHYENPGLFCDYFTNGNPGLILEPMKREVVSLEPYVVLYHSFVSDAEAESVKSSAEPGLRRSVVASGETQSAAEYRISKSAWLNDTTHPIVRRLDQRITALTGLTVQPPYAEYLQVVNYGIGGHYEPHFDHATSESSPVYKLKTGNRLATFMIYLSSVEAGGSTAFIYANFSVPVVKNAAVFWWNLHRNGQGNGDTLHAGCPVLVGDKWVANKWVHEHGQEFHRPCSFDPEE
ncbi:prolyl 4-hydroxylase subunit alpha-3 isoform X1 [Lepisosteus oculatus]|uniref:prolyl 4-hydroxylase subunit alpha-3 isoform X1 n=1 Tax=Lepisosteus oculatus TaxID=7918 RepID=UPI0003EAA3C0